MTSTDFMEEKEVFELLGKKKQQYGGYVKIMGFLNLSSPTPHVIVGKQLQTGWKMEELIAGGKYKKINKQ